MSAAPGCEFPNPCPVCDADDDHAAWRALSEGSPGWMFGATHCPHPSERGHGTGCCCAGRSQSPWGVYAGISLRPEKELPFRDVHPAPGLEERVAALEAFAGKFANRVTAHEWNDEQIARFQEEFEAAAKKFPQHEMRLLPSVPPLTPDQVRYLLRECVTVVKPGETLVIRDRNWNPEQVREIQQWMDAERESGRIFFKVLAVIGEELAVAEPEVFPVQPDEGGRETYHAEVTRDGGFWSVRVPEIARTTQARTPAEIEPMARDLIAVMEDIPAGSFGLEISGDVT